MCTHLHAGSARRAVPSNLRVYTYTAIIYLCKFGQSMATKYEARAKLMDVMKSNNLAYTRIHSLPNVVRQLKRLVMAVCHPNRKNH